MSTSLQIEQSGYKHFFTKILAVVCGLGLIFGLSLYSRFGAIGESGSPEKFAADLSGNQKTTFNLGEEGYLNLRVYGDDKQGSYNKADAILILDVSGSMGSGPGSKLEQAKNALKTFVDKVNVNKGVKIGLVWYSTTCGLTSPLVAVDSIQTKTNLKKLIDGMNSGLATSIGCGLNLANAELINNGRSDAIKRIVLFTDGMENTPPYVNLTLFTVPEANDANTPVKSGSQLARSISGSIKYYTVHYGASGNACTQANGCSLMRFAAAKTNSLNLATGLNWQSNYGLATNIDDQCLYKTADATELENIYKAILDEIESLSGVPVRISEKLAGELSFIELTSVIDKGGRSYAATVADDASGAKVFQLDGLPKSYDCNPGETACINAADGNAIRNNYADFKIHFKASRKGAFDADSNYQGCDSGSMSQVSSDSKVEYLNPSDNAVYKTMAFNYLCLTINASAAAENIMKVTFGDPGRAVRKATFEAGETVYVSLIVQETDTSRGDFVITDTIPKSVSGNVNFDLERGGAIAATCTATASDGEIKFEGGTACQGGTTLDLKEGINTIKYQYTI